MKSAFVFILWVLFLSHLCEAQDNIFGVHAGYILQGKGGIAVGNGEILAELLGKEAKFVGASYQHQLSRALAVRLELNYYTNSLQSLVPNDGTACGFCDLVTIGSSYYHTFELPATANLRLPITRRFAIAILAGLGLDINVPSGKSPDYSFGAPNDRVTDVMNALEHSPKTYLTNYTCGIRFDLWRITLVARYQHNLSSTLTNNLRLWGNEYVFDTNSHQLHFSAGYNFPWITSKD